MMSRRFKLGTFFGIALFIHWSFFLMPALVAYSEWSNGGRLIDVLLTLGFVVLLFACVILHEYGHVLAARAFGVGTRDITMLPIGGVARLERMPEEPWQELVVAVAGPAVNVVIATTLGIGIIAVYGFDLSGNGESNMFAHRLFAVNIALIVFNMIPAFPMDGGRVFRSVASMFTNHRRATWLAMRLGQVIAIALFALGLTNLSSMPFLPFIAAFIFWVGMMEYRQVDIASQVKDLRVRDAMLRQFCVASIDSTVAEFAQRAADELQRAFPVVDNGVYRGLLPMEPLAIAMQTAAGQQRTVGEIMRWESITVDENDLLEEVLVGMPRDATQVPVLDSQNKVVGLLDTDSCLRRVALRSGASNQPAAPVSIDYYSPPGDER
ncbi:Putative zinc metalloprotease Rip3 [Rosistilla carotiformis]|uniref:Zinc metalloprotease n=1 Tax=Rosistilla carotiformis TaxID=2528017 RepID=A0A518K0L0_9BACT|nr:site-2 protease family protein [Rosistilla carotiformis]QDV71336.1 Putative zinc metalloprotease Rip3 [Rosistilla carotiformis]